MIQRPVYESAAAPHQCRWNADFRTGPEATFSDSKEGPTESTRVVSDFVRCYCGRTLCGLQRHRKLRLVNPNVVRVDAEAPARGVLWRWHVEDLCEGG